MTRMSSSAKAAGSQRLRADIEPGERHAEAGLGRRVDEAALAERRDAFLEDGVGNLDALLVIDLAQLLDELLLARFAIEFARDEVLAGGGAYRPHPWPA